MVSACMWLRYLNRSMTACQEYTSWTFRLTPPWSPTRNLVHWCLLEGYYNYYQAPAASSRFDSGPPPIFGSSLMSGWIPRESTAGKNMAGAQARLGLHGVVAGRANDTWCVPSERRGLERCLVGHGGHGGLGTRGLGKSHPKPSKTGI